MFLADTAPVISISLEAAGTLGVSVAGGLLGLGKVLVAYFQKRDMDLLDEVKAGREERLEVGKELLAIQRESITAVGGLERAIAGLTNRLEQIEEHTSPTCTKGSTQ
jgi:hypothetical protein